MRTASAGVPRSVINLRRSASVSHRGLVEPERMLEALQARGGVGESRRSLAIALQEAEIGELVELMIDRVLDGRALHVLLASMQTEGSIRRADLVEWSEIFS